MSASAILKVAAVVAAVAVGTAAALTVEPTRKFAEISHLKAAMLTKQWQGLLLDVEQKVGIVPELGSTSAGVMRFGPELERRTKCKRQFQMLYDSTFQLAMADKAGGDNSALVETRRSLIPSLNIEGRARGPQCAVFASLSVPATISLVERLQSEWSVLAIAVNPTERKIDTIAAAEAFALGEIGARARAAGASIRLLASVRETLAGDSEQLGLERADFSTGGSEEWDEDRGSWLRCKT